MKKIITITLILTLALSAVTGCTVNKPKYAWAKTVKIVRHWMN